MKWVSRSHRYLLALIELIITLYTQVYKLNVSNVVWAVDRTLKAMSTQHVLMLSNFFLEIWFYLHGRSCYCLMWPQSDFLEPQMHRWRTMTFKQQQKLSWIEPSTDQFGLVLDISAFIAVDDCSLPALPWLKF